jgi:hypothetical protein
MAAHQRPGKQQQQPPHSRSLLLLAATCLGPMLGPMAAAAFSSFGSSFRLSTSKPWVMQVPQLPHSDHQAAATMAALGGLLEWRQQMT